MAGCGLLVDLDPPDPSDPPAGPDASVRFDAGVVSMDAMVPDVPLCFVVAERCNGLDDDCDERVDEGFDLLNDPTTCGACDAVCPSEGGAAYCDMGRCRIVCDPERANCDRAVETGCETDLGSPESCGSCDNDCSVRGLRLCQSVPDGFVCAADCPSGTASCDGGCVNLDADDGNCGGCGRACFVDIHGDVGCEFGTCVVRDCGDNRRDCNLDPADGCELQLGTLSDCRACGDSCLAGELCTASGCARG